MADDLTISELGRRIDAGLMDLKDDLRDLGRRLDSKVSFERYQLEQQAMQDAYRQMQERVLAIETAREKEREQREEERISRESERRKVEDRRRQDRRWILSALVVPVLVVILQAYITAKGAGS